MKRREMRVKEAKRQERRKPQSRGGKRRHRSGAGSGCQVSQGVWAAAAPLLNLLGFCAVFIDGRRKDDEKG